MNWYYWDHEALVLNVYVQPRSSKDQVVGPHGDYLKIKITAAPTEGKANAHLTAFLAKLCKVSKSQVSLMSGETGRQKRICIQSPRQLPPGVQR